ncbi:MAG: ATP-binding cassette domain-containing protein [Bacteroidetes bacterium]|nr:MAG: ATP-binding cassette domain-containing protein [Bacteroidota bacterium]
MLLEVMQLRKRFGTEEVLRGVSLSVPAHATLSIVGPSGCGKTTLLKIIAGLTTADGGTVRLDGEDLTGVPPQRRGTVYLYQEPLLFPHLDVFENVAFGLRLRRVPEAELRRRTEAMLAELDLTTHARKRPRQLSGGQRQRVALGRAIIVNPRLLLLDEPFASLDVDIRAAMQDLFLRLVRQYRITSLFVTHDLKEALRVGDRLATLRAGVLKSYPTKEAFIDDPETGVQRELAFWERLRTPTLSSGHGPPTG